MNEWRDFVNLNNELDKKKDIAERTATNKGPRNTPVMAKNPKKKIGVLDYIEKVKEMNEPKIANQEIFKNNINRKEPNEPKDDYIKKLEKFGIENSQKPEPFYPKQATPRQVGDLAARLEENRQRTGEMSTWNMLKAAADTPEAKNEIREIIRKDYKDNGPKDMDQDDLKWIGKGKVQTEKIYPKIEVPSVNLNLIKRDPPEPEISINQRIKVLADQRLKNEQRAWDYKNGRGGIAEMLRPK